MSDSEDSDVTSDEMMRLLDQMLALNKQITHLVKQNNELREKIRKTEQNVNITVNNTVAMNLEQSKILSICLGKIIANPDSYKQYLEKDGFVITNKDFENIVYK